MLTSHQVYRYNRLPRGDVFRYLVLHPGLDDALECDIHTAAMAHTQFEAISYTWGKDLRDQKVICEGRVMMVTPNLARVLRRMRSPDRPLRLWADSICINQESCEEKEHQVGLMGKIYREAERVWLYIGSDDDHHGPGVSSLLEEVDQMIQTIWATLDPASWNNFPYPDDNDPVLLDSRWQSLQKLLAESWFDRGWVVQEAALGRHARVVWGQSTFDWDKLMRVYVWMSTRAVYIYHTWGFSEVLINAHKHVYLEANVDFGCHFFDELSWGTPSILRTLTCAKELELGDPRDRIYAFMGLPQRPGEHVAPCPNYHASYLDTYRDFAKQYVEFTKSTEILDSVSHNNESHSRAPSWVPHWDISTWSLAQNTISTSPSLPRTPSTIEPVVTDDWRLKVRGMIFDTVRFVSHQLEWDTTTVETITKLWNSVRSFPVQYHYTVQNNDSEPYLGSYQLVAFLSALSAGTYDGKWTKWRRAEASFILEAQLATSDDQRPGPAATTNEEELNSNVFYDHARAHTHRRTFVLTTSGYMGLAPTPARVGDTCGFVYGCKTPCILREDTEKGMQPVSPRVTHTFSYRSTAGNDVYITSSLHERLIQT
jgi:hypothetical protein